MFIITLHPENMIYMNPSKKASNTDASASNANDATKSALLIENPSSVPFYILRWLEALGEHATSDHKFLIAKSTYESLDRTASFIWTLKMLGFRRSLGADGLDAQLMEWLTPGFRLLSERSDYFIPQKLNQLFVKWKSVARILDCSQSKVSNASTKDLVSAKELNSKQDILPELIPEDVRIFWRAKL
jgi:hypothetical protein